MSIFDDIGDSSVEEIDSHIQSGADILSETKSESFFNKNIASPADKAVNTVPTFGGINAIQFKGEFATTAEKSLIDKRDRVLRGEGYFNQITQREDVGIVKKYSSIPLKWLNIAASQIGAVVGDALVHTEDEKVNTLENIVTLGATSAAVAFPPAAAILYGGTSAFDMGITAIFDSNKDRRESSRKLQTGEYVEEPGWAKTNFLDAMESISPHEDDGDFERALKITAGIGFVNSVARPLQMLSSVKGVVSSVKNGLEKGADSTAMKNAVAGIEIETPNGAGRTNTEKVLNIESTEKTTLLQKAYDSSSELIKDIKDLPTYATGSKASLISPGTLVHIIDNAINLEKKETGRVLDAVVNELDKRLKDTDNVLNELSNKYSYSTDKYKLVNDAVGSTVARNINNYNPDIEVKQPTNITKYTSGTMLSDSKITELINNSNMPKAAKRKLLKNEEYVVIDVHPNLVDITPRGKNKKMSFYSDSYSRVKPVVIDANSILSSVATGGKIKPLINSGAIPESIRHSGKVKVAIPKRDIGLLDDLYKTKMRGIKEPQTSQIPALMDGTRYSNNINGRATVDMRTVKSLGALLDNKREIQTDLARKAQSTGIKDICKII